MNPGVRITAVVDHQRARTVFAYDSMPGVRHTIAISDLELNSASSKADVMAIAQNVASKLGIKSGEPEAQAAVADPVDFAVMCPRDRALRFRPDGIAQGDGGRTMGVVKVERDPFLFKKTERTVLSTGGGAVATEDGITTRVERQAEHRYPVQLVEYRFGDTDGRRGPWAIARRRYAFDFRRGVVYTDPTIEVEWDMESAEAAAWLRPFIWDPGD